MLVAITEAYGKEVDTTQIDNVEEIAGQGIKANIEEKVIIGNDRILHKENIQHEDSIAMLKER